MTTNQPARGARRSVTATLPKAEIVRRQDISHELWLIWLKPEVPFMFKPGQYCTIGVGDLERPYSIVSAPEEDLIELFVELVPKPAGVLTPVLYELQEGAEVTLRPRAKGIFTLDQKFKNHVMVATVTGVAPYVSMLRSLERNGKLADINAYVIDGASYADEFVYDKELAEFDARHSNVTFVSTISRPQEERNKGWDGQIGRTNEIVEEYLKKFNLSAEDTLVYACGHPGMIEDVKHRMTGIDFPFKEERFWKE